MLPFSVLQERFYFPLINAVLQLHHALRGQGADTVWTLSLTPIFHSISSVAHAKGLIVQFYSMLQSNHLDCYPSKACAGWERDPGQISGDQWEDSLQAVATSSPKIIPTIYSTKIPLYSYQAAQNGCTCRYSMLQVQTRNG